MTTEERPWLRPEPVGGVWLMRQGNHAVVYVERDGKWYPAISEHLDGSFSHCISAEGIRGLDKPAGWLTEK